VKKIILLIVIFLLVGCSNNKEFYLTDKYYNKGEFIEVKEDELNSNESYLLYTYNNFCVLPVHCENIFKQVMEKYKIDILSMPFDTFKNTSFHKEVKYAPSILIIKNGKIITYLDANSDKDLEKYQNITKFEEWLKEYIYLEKTTN
jgi:hypothetical protein